MLAQRKPISRLGIGSRRRHAVSELERSVQASIKAGFDDLIRLTLDARSVSNDTREDLQSTFQNTAADANFRLRP